MIFMTVNTVVRIMFNFLHVPDGLLNTNTANGYPGNNMSNIKYQILARHIKCTISLTCASLSES